MDFLRFVVSRSVPVKLLIYAILLITLTIFVLINLNIRHVEDSINQIGSKAGLNRENIRQLQKEKRQGIYLIGLVALIIIILSIGLMFSHHLYQARGSELKNAEIYQDYVLAKIDRGMIILDRQGRIITLNDWAREILGLKEVEKDTGISEILPDEASMKNFLASLTGTNRIPQEVELRLKGQKGQDLFLRINGSPVLNDLEEKIGSAVFIEEITEKKKLEARAKINEHLSTIGRIADGLIHEIRKPLNAMNIYLQLMEEDLEDHHPGDYGSMYEYISTLKKTISHLEEILTNFREYSLPGTIEKDIVDIHQLLRETTILYEPEARQMRIELHDYLNSPHHLVLGDSHKLKQVFFNLLTNAMESMKNGGKVAVETELEENGLFIAVMIRDSGYGIPMENIDRIFNLYFTTKEEGSGLGLTISSRIIHQHGGTIDAVSWMGEGSLFTVRLPVEKVQS